MPNHETTSPDHDHLHLVHRADHDHPMGDFFRPGGDLQRRSRRATVHRSVARFHERSFVFSHREYGLLLHFAHDFDHTLLRFDLDQSVEKTHPDGYERRPNGTHATEVESESGQDVGSRGDSIRLVVATFVRDFRPD